MTVQFNANDRAALHFSGTRDAMRSPLKAQPKFGCQPLYSGPFHGVNFFTDFNDGSSNTEALGRFNDILRFTTKHKKHIERHLKQFADTGQTLTSNTLQHPLSRLQTYFQGIGNFFKRLLNVLRGRSGQLPINNFDDIPPGHIDYASLALHRIAARQNKEIHVHVTDPGVGNKKDADGNPIHDRSILLTPKHGVLIGPDNGSLGLLTEQLKNDGEPYELRRLDLSKIQELLRVWKNNPQYELPETFHARDAFAVAAAAVAGGIDPQLLSAPPEKKPAKTNPFVKTIQPLPAEKEKVATLSAFQDRTFGNAKTNLVLSHQEAKKLLAENAVFNINTPEKTLNGGKGIDFPFVPSFSHAGIDQPLIYLGSSNSPKEDHRFVELALNEGNVSKRLGIGPSHTKTLTVERVK